MTREITLATKTAHGVLPNFIASNLRLLRKQAGWSQSELAERVGLNRGNIASYERGSAEPSICKLLRISNLFELSTRSFTRRDLSNAAELALARSAYRSSDSEQREKLASYRQRSQQLAHLIDSSYELFADKRARTQVPCKEAEMFAAHYVQLHELAKQLSQQHDALLDQLNCHCA